MEQLMETRESSGPTANVKDTSSKAKQPNTAVQFTPSANNLPFEIISKVYEYFNTEEKTPELVCNLALVSKNLLEFFTQPHIWSEIDQSENYVLLRGDGAKFWSSADLNKWYGDFVNGTNSHGGRPVHLPVDIWRHRKLLEPVLRHLNIKVAPSNDDFKPYENDEITALLFINRMASGDCFSYLSNELRSKASFALAAVKRYRENCILH